MPNVIVTGATGINGRALVKSLCKDPEKWGTVYAMSRSMKEEYPDNVKHIATDFLAPAEEIAAKLKGIQAEYVFFATYKQEDSEQASWDTNTRMLQAFLDALRISGLEKTSLKRVILALGAKWYGVHLGPVRVPCAEDDPRVEEGYPPNFYYGQLDLLKKAAEGQKWDWVAMLPNDIIGFAEGNFMNISMSLALYATITKELGEELVFPGCERCYLGWDSHAYAPLIAEFQLWAATNPACSNQLFNMDNGDHFTWSKSWSHLARRFDCKIPANHFSQSKPTPFYQKKELGANPPRAIHAEEAGIKGTVPAGVLENQISLVKWAERPEVKQAWETLSEREGLNKAAFGHGTWNFADFVLGRNYDVVLSMTKARKLGWTGYIDTWDAYLEVFGELERQKIIPKVTGITA